MGSLRVQPPNGVVRNLTDVFQFLRTNATQAKHSYEDVDIGGSGMSRLLYLMCLDSVALLDDLERGTAVHFKMGANVTPSWVNVLDEVNFEITK